MSLTKTATFAAEEFDYVHFVIPDVNGIPRGLVVPKKFVKEKMKEGVDLFYGTLMMGPLTEFKLNVDEFLKGLNHTWLPNPTTLFPTPWGDSGGRRTASVLCDLMTREGSVDELSTRHIAQSLVKKLKAKHGLTIQAAFEFEFTAYKKDTGESLGSDTYRLLDLRMTQPGLDLVYELCEVLGQAGLHVTTITPEFIPGQWELNFQPREGIEAADLAFHVKNAVKIFFRRKGYEATFMTFPQRMCENGNGLHFNMSLWAEKGKPDALTVRSNALPAESSSLETKDAVNSMLDINKKDGVSDLSLRWNAGLLAHAPAMTSVCCPTTNCYRRFHNFGPASKATWGVETRSGLTRFKVARRNVYLESRLPSSAANPYLVLAAHLVSGMHGLEAEITSPPPLDVEHAQKLPHSLEEALLALEKDQVMREGLGERFVTTYLTARREYEVNEYKEKAFATDEEQFEYERKKYFTSL